MRQELNQNFNKELPIENNSPVELSKISLPDNWWSAQNSYETLLNRNVKIVRINEEKDFVGPVKDYPGWDIKAGDFIGNFESPQRILTREGRQKIDVLTLAGFLVLVIGIIILISYGIAETIRW